MLKKNAISTIMAATAMTTLMAMPANAQSLEDLQKQIELLQKQVAKLAEAQKKAAKVKKAEPAAAIATDDGLFEFNMSGRIFADYVRASDRNNTMDNSATEFRAARIGIAGKAWKTVKYKLGLEFTGNEVEVKDAHMSFKTSVGDVTVGQMKTPNSLDEATSGRHLAFLERSSFTDAFSLGRQTGVQWSKAGSTWTAKAGIFKGAMDDDGQGSLTLAARATYGGKMDGGKWIVGASVRDRNTDGQMRYRQRPHVHLSDRFVNTGKIGNGNDFFYGVEAGAQWGSFNAAAEYAVLSAAEAAANGGSAKMHGGYAEVGYFITGESRTLKLEKGAWDRPKVNKPFNEGGMGAISLNARFDTIDLTGDGIYGGEQDTWALGVNWYLNRHTRIVANYSRSNITKAFDVSSADENGENKVDALGVRFQVDW